MNLEKRIRAINGCFDVIEISDAILALPKNEQLGHITDLLREIVKKGSVQHADTFQMCRILLIKGLLHDVQ